MSLGLGGAMSLQNKRYTAILPRVIPEDPGTTCHVTFDEKGIPFDSKGGVWNKFGSPTVVQIPGLPPGVQNASGFGDIYKSATSWTFLSSDFYAVVVCTMATQTEIISSENAGFTAGWALRHAGLDVNGTATCTAPAGSTSAGSLCVVLCGLIRSTSTWLFQTNGCVVQTGIRAMTPTSNSTIGGAGDGSASGSGSVIFEVLTSATTPSAALFDSITRQVYSNLGNAG